MFAPWAMITPSAPASGTTISAVTECDLFLMFSDAVLRQAPHAAEEELGLPLDQHRPAGVSRVHLLAQVGRRSAARCSASPRSATGAAVRGASPASAWTGRWPGSSPSSCRRAPRRRRRRRAVFSPMSSQGVLCLRHRGPALVVDAAVAEHLEVLRLVPLRRLGVVERVEHADALDGLLLHAVHRDRLGAAPPPRGSSARRR